MRDENGFVDIAHITALATSLPTAENSLTPGAHWGMGIREGEGYTRATSPLRRFADLIGHYQIHRALLGEKPYFSRTYLEDHLKWLKHDDQLKKRTETLHQRFWVLMALRRWLEAPRTDIPDPLSNLEAIIMRQVRFNTVTNSFQAEVRIPRLGISGFLENISLRRRGDWVISRTIPVKFQELLLGVRPRLVLSEPNKKPDSLI
jgi:exoribonuclease R